MSIMKNSSKRKLHDQYLLSTKYLVTTQHTQTPKTQSKNHVRKISYISNPSNPSVRKLSITKACSKRKSLQQKQHQRMKGKSKKEKQVEKDSQSQSKTKKILSDNQRQKSSREKNDFSQNTCIGASRINSERGICLDAIYNRCSTVIASYEKKYLKLKKQNQRLKNENKRMKGNQ